MKTIKAFGAGEDKYTIGNESILRKRSTELGEIPLKQSMESSDQTSFDFSNAELSFENSTHSLGGRGRKHPLYETVERYLLGDLLDTENFFGYFSSDDSSDCSSEATGSSAENDNSTIEKDAYMGPSTNVFDQLRSVSTTDSLLRGSGSCSTLTVDSAVQSHRLPFFKSGRESTDIEAFPNSETDRFLERTAKLWSSRNGQSKGFPTSQLSPLYSVDRDKIISKTSLAPLEPSRATGNTRRKRSIPTFFRESVVKARLDETRDIVEPDSRPLVDNRETIDDSYRHHSTLPKVAGSFDTTNVPANLEMALKARLDRLNKQLAQMPEPPHPASSPGAPSLSNVQENIEDGDAKVSLARLLTEVFMKEEMLEKSIARQKETSLLIPPKPMFSNRSDNRMKFRNIIVKSPSKVGGSHEELEIVFDDDNKSSRTRKDTQSGELWGNNNLWEVWTPVASPKAVEVVDFSKGVNSLQIDCNSDSVLQIHNSYSKGGINKAPSTQKSQIPQHKEDFRSFLTNAAGSTTFEKRLSLNADNAEASTTFPNLQVDLPNHPTSDNTDGTARVKKLLNNVETPNLRKQNVCVRNSSSKMTTSVAKAVDRLNQRTACREKTDLSDPPSTNVSEVHASFSTAVTSPLSNQQISSIPASIKSKDGISVAIPKISSEEIRGMDLSIEISSLPHKASNKSVDSSKLFGRVKTSDGLVEKVRVSKRCTTVEDNQDHTDLVGLKLLSRSTIFSASQSFDGSLKHVSHRVSETEIHKGGSFKSAVHRVDESTSQTKDDYNSVVSNVPPAVVPSINVQAGSSQPEKILKDNHPTVLPRTVTGSIADDFVDFKVNIICDDLCNEFEVEQSYDKCPELGELVTVADGTNSYDVHNEDMVSSTEIVPTKNKSFDEKNASSLDPKIGESGPKRKENSESITGIADAALDFHENNHIYDTGSVVTKKSARSLMSASAKTIDDGHSTTTKSKTARRLRALQAISSLKKQIAKSMTESHDERASRISLREKCSIRSARKESKLSRQEDKGVDESVLSRSNPSNKLERGNQETLSFHVDKCNSILESTSEQQEPKGDRSNTINALAQVEDRDPLPKTKDAFDVLHEEQQQVRECPSSHMNQEQSSHPDVSVVPCTNSSSSGMQEIISDRLAKSKLELYEKRSASDQSDEKVPLETSNPIKVSRSQDGDNFLNPAEMEKVDISGTVDNDNPHRRKRVLQMKGFKSNLKKIFANGTPKKGTDSNCKSVAFKENPSQNQVVVTLNVTGVSHQSKSSSKQMFRSSRFSLSKRAATYQVAKDRNVECQVGLDPFEEEDEAQSIVSQSGSRKEKILSALKRYVAARKSKIIQVDEAAAYRESDLSSENAVSGSSDDKKTSSGEGTSDSDYIETESSTTQNTRTGSRSWRSSISNATSQTGQTRLTVEERRLARRLATDLKILVKIEKKRRKLGDSSAEASKLEELDKSIKLLMSLRENITSRDNERLNSATNE